MLFRSNLSLNTGYQATRNDSLIYLFRVRMWLRANLLDNLKKPINDSTRKILDFERRYTLEIDKIIYEPAENCYLLFEEINKLVAKKNYYDETCLKFTRDLVKISAATMSDMDAVKMRVIGQAKIDYCWHSENYPKVVGSGKGLAFIRRKQKTIRLCIVHENYTELLRHKAIDAEWKRRYNKFTKMTRQNQRQLILVNKAVRKERKIVERAIKKRLKK